MPVHDQGHEVPDWLLSGHDLRHTKDASASKAEGQVHGWSCGARPLDEIVQILRRDGVDDVLGISVVLEDKTFELGDCLPVVYCLVDREVLCPLLHDIDPPLRFR
jgi:hypothetical protein